jgi:hypothetical protein
MIKHRAKSAFWHATGATALMEFALLTPFLIAALLGTVEISRYIAFRRHVTALNNVYARYVSALPTSMTLWDFSSLGDMMFWIIPEFAVMASAQGLTSSTDNTRAVQVTSVSFQPSVTGCTTSCTYTTAKVMWYYLPSGGTANRPCGTLQTPTATPSPLPNNTIPAGYFAKGGLVIIDFYVTYVPLFKSIVPQQTIYSTAYAQPVYFPDAYMTATAASATCP